MPTPRARAEPEAEPAPRAGEDEAAPGVARASPSGSFPVGSAGREEAAAAPARPARAESLEAFAPGRPSPRSIAGWAAAAGLLVAAVAGALRPLPEPPPEAVLGAGLRAEEIRVRRVPHLSGAELLVVSGRIANRGPVPRALGAPLEVRLLDAGGAPLGREGALAGPALREETLREGELSGLVAGAPSRARELGRRRLAAGEAVPFDAVFVSVPERARRYELRVVGADAGGGGGLPGAGGGSSESAPATEASGP